MVTKLDVFIELYSNAGPQKITDIVKDLKQPQSEYDRIRKILEVLSAMKLVARSRHGYAPLMNAKNQHLFDMLSYCIRNGVNYNDILDETLAAYLSRAFPKKSFGAKDIKLHSRTFSKISSMLEKNGFLIVLSRKPFRAVVPYNSLLGDVIAYYGHRPAVARKQLDDEYFKVIEKELAIFRKLRVKNNRKYQELLENFQIRFIHHSLSIEGNPITLAQTFKLLKEKVIPENVSIESVNEVQNYQKAFLQMLQNVRNRSPIGKETILNYHFIALQEKEHAGKIRDDVVTIKGNVDFYVAPFEEIGLLLDKLIDEYNAFLKGKKRNLKEILDFAAYFHNEFQHIHPFFDGNSRTTRLITFHFLQMNGIPIFDIPLGMLEEYVLATKGARKRADKELEQALQRIVLYNLKTINEKLL